jgi:hypothetical protein
MNVVATQNQQPAGGINGVKLIIGIFFALLGIVLTLDNFDLADADRFLPYWPVFLIIIGLMKLQDSDNRAPGVLAIVVGALLLPDWGRFSIFDLWPVILIVGGLAIVAHAFGFRASLLEGSGSTILAIFGVRKEAVTSRNYTGGRIIAFMGGCELDLTKSDMENGPAEIEIIAMWGGVEIKVPEGWEVIGNTLPIMGGADIRTKAAPGGRKLIVNGVVLMAGVDIKSIAAEAA